MLAFSTCWNMHRHLDGESMVAELARFGVDCIEVGHGIRVSQMEGILRAVRRGDVRVASVHNFCPQPLEVPGDSPDCYEFTSHRAADRRRAIALTIQSIQVAAALGAGHVVVHGGRARTMKTQREWLRMLESGEFFTKRHGALKVAAVKKREAVGPMLLGRLEQALRELLPVAEREGVRLALENRERYEDVPSEREMPGFLDRFTSPFLGYWHDFGHARIKENLGFLDHRRWLARASGHLHGCHVHDVQWPNDDHLPPFSGEVDFAGLMALVPHGTTQVFEMSPYVPPEIAFPAWRRWRSLFPA